MMLTTVFEKTSSGGRLPFPKMLTSKLPRLCWLRSWEWSVQSQFQKGLLRVTSACSESTHSAPQFCPGCPHCCPSENSLVGHCIKSKELSGSSRNMEEHCIRVPRLVYFFFKLGEQGNVSKLGTFFPGLFIHLKIHLKLES